MTPGVTRVLGSRSALRTAYDVLPAGTRRVTVMTMGALHEGHAQLIREARKHAGVDGCVTVTIFVNPLQFGSADDLAAYPRPLQDDVDLCAHEGADLVFTPTPAVVYSAGDLQVSIDPGPLGTLLEGAIRPGHFRGVLTVVAKLLQVTSAQVAVFGEKDFQQLVLIRQMCRDLDLPVRIEAGPIVRDDDGLALSSRNARLSAVDRSRAAVVPRAMQVGQRAAARGESVREILAAVAEVLATDGEAEVDYVVVTDPHLGPAPGQGPARLLVAVNLSGVRLLDNAAIEIGLPS